jgi:hypothetical protein
VRTCLCWQAANGAPDGGFARSLSQVGAACGTIYYFYITACTTAPVDDVRRHVDPSSSSAHATQSDDLPFPSVSRPGVHIGHDCVPVRATACATAMAKRKAASAARSSHTAGKMRTTPAAVDWVDLTGPTASLEVVASRRSPGQARVAAAPTRTSSPRRSGGAQHASGACAPTEVVDLTVDTDEPSDAPQTIAPAGRPPAKRSRKAATPTVPPVAASPLSSNRAFNALSAKLASAAAVSRRVRTLDRGLLAAPLARLKCAIVARLSPHSARRLAGVAQRAHRLRVAATRRARLLRLKCTAAARLSARNARRLSAATARRAHRLRLTTARGVRKHGPGVVKQLRRAAVGAGALGWTMLKLGKAGLLLAGEGLLEALKMAAEHMEALRVQEEARVRAEAAAEQQRVQQANEAWKAYRAQQREQQLAREAARVCAEAAAARAAQEEEAARAAQKQQRLAAEAARTPRGTSYLDITNELCDLPDVSARQTWLDVMQRAITRSCTAPAGNSYSPPGLRVLRVERVRNKMAWDLYVAGRAKLEANLHDLPGGAASAVAPPPLSACLPASMLRGSRFHASVNECYLWHGTAKDSSESIASHGFNERLCSTEGFLGAGNYFADRSTKADQYAPADPQGMHRLFLARVCLGHPKRLPAGDQCPKTRELPLVPNGRSGRRYDCHIGTPGRHGYTEYVVYNGLQAFPEFVVTYKRSAA